MPRTTLLGFAAAVLIAAPAFAAGPFTLNLREGMKLSTTAPSRISDSLYNYTAEMTEIPSLEIAITAAEIKHIEHRVTTFTAIGEDGPWWRVPGIEETAPWQPLPYKSLNGKTEITLPNPHETQLRAPQATNADIIKALKKAPDLQATDDPARWLKLAKKCTTPSTTPCYIYTGKDEIRVTKRDGSSVTLTIQYPGGC